VLCEVGLPFNASRRWDRGYERALPGTSLTLSSHTRYYCLSILDKHHHPDISFDQGMKILRMCTDELQRRLPIDFKGMTVKVVKKDGVQEIEYDTSKQVLSA
jgi:20S proteasome subunit beta 4